MSATPGQGKRLVWGPTSAAAMTIVAAVVWGRTAILGAACFGGVATGLQLLAARVVARSGRPMAVDHLKVYAIGMGLRLMGVVMLGVAVSLDPTTFRPLASATGYLGTVLPLLYLETRLSR